MYKSQAFEMAPLLSLSMELLQDKQRNLHLDPESGPQACFAGPCHPKSDLGHSWKFSYTLQ